MRDGTWELCALFDVDCVPKQMSVAELQTGFLALAKQLASAEETSERRGRFKARLRSSPNFGRRVARARERLAA